MSSPVLSPKTDERNLCTSTKVKSNQGQIDVVMHHRKMQNAIVERVSIKSLPW